MTEIFSTPSRPDAYERAAAFAKANRNLVIYVAVLDQDGEERYFVCHLGDDDSDVQLGEMADQNILFVFRAGMEEA